MPRSTILRFCDFYTAHLAAHQLQLEGWRTEVFEYTLSTSPWYDGGFRLLVFDEREFDGTENFAPLEPGAVGKAIDTLLRLLAVGGAALALIFLLYSILTYQPEIIPWVLVSFVISLPFIALGITPTIIAYGSFRKGKTFGKLMIRGVGWCICLGWFLNTLLSLILMVRW